MRVTELLREWFEAEPWRTSRELFGRLQEGASRPLPRRALRTLQRRTPAVDSTDFFMKAS